MLTFTLLLLLFNTNVSPEADKNIIWNFDLHITFFFLCDCSSSTLYINCIESVTDSMPQTAAK